MAFPKHSASSSRVSISLGIVIHEPYIFKDTHFKKGMFPSTHIICYLSMYKPQVYACMHEEYSCDIIQQIIGNGLVEDLPWM